MTRTLLLLWLGVVLTVGIAADCRAEAADPLAPEPAPESMVKPSTAKKHHKSPKHKKKKKKIKPLQTAPMPVSK